MLSILNFEQSMLSTVCAAVAVLFAWFRMDAISTRKKLDGRDQAREKERAEWDKQRGQMWKALRRLENRVAVVDACPVNNCPAKVTFARMKAREEQEDQHH